MIEMAPIKANSKASQHSRIRLLEEIYQEPMGRIP
jgi:hypothetical protein